MSRSPRILIVDDMPAVRMILRNMLETAGYSDLVEAEDGEQAWELLRNSVDAAGIPAVRLIVSDWNMPGMTGIELLRAVRSDPALRHLPFLIITAEGDGSHLDEASAAGVTDYVVKPFGADHLSEQVARALAALG
jgi:two-component system chemotaxis response regulator CheY